MGFYGKSLRQPAQLYATNDVFAPTGAALSLTQRKIAVNDDTDNSGKDVAITDGKIVENVRVDSAGRMLDTAQMITELEKAGTEYVTSDVGNCSMDCLSRL